VYGNSSDSWGLEGVYISDLLSDPSFGVAIGVTLQTNPGTTVLAAVEIDTISIEFFATGT
jgi:hypothetical protein